MLVWSQNLRQELRLRWCPSRCRQITEEGMQTRRNQRCVILKPRLLHWHWSEKTLRMLFAHHQRRRGGEAAVENMIGRGRRRALMAATEIEEKLWKPCPWMYRCLGVLVAKHQRGRQGEAAIVDMKGRGRRRAMAGTEIEEKQREEHRQMHRWSLQVQTRGVGASIVILVAEIHQYGIDQQEHFAGPMTKKKDVNW